MALPMRVLLIEDDAEHADLIRSQLARKHRAEIEVVWKDSLAAGLAQLESGGSDVILLDLGLPDSTIDKTLDRVLSKARGTPVVVLSSLEDQEFGLKAVHDGAQDYISKSWLDGELLFRSLRYAIERKTTEEELRKANRAKDEFLATLSHELRTPIGVILGFAEILSEPGSSEEDREQALEAILRSARLQVSLINDLLDMSRIITGKLHLQSKSQALAPIVVSSVETVRLAARNKQIDIRTSLDERDGCVMGDQVRLQQVLWNLLVNAVKFTPAGGRIDVRLRRLDNQFVIEVEDNGEGIAPDFLPFVFDRFRQQDGSVRRQYTGLGLGLAIVRHLVELHGGSVVAQSAGHGKGSIFTVSFPVAPAIENNVIEPEQPEPKRQSAGREKTNALLQSDLEGIKVLAVDDSTDLLKLVQLILQRHSAAVTSVASAAEATEALRRVAPDVIVCDIGMPDEDGYSFIGKLRRCEREEGRPPVPAIALTAYARDEERQAALKAGFQVHLSKPIEEGLLIQSISRLAGRTTPATTQTRF